MTNAVTVADTQAVSEFIRTGNLAQMSAQEQAMIVKKACEAYGLEPLFRPFDIIEFQGKARLYLTSNGANQIARQIGLSRKIISTTFDEKTLIETVEVEATDSNGRTEQQISCLWLGKYEANPLTKKVEVVMLSGLELANARMKNRSKALRRAAMMFVGFSEFDEAPVSDVSASIMQNVTPPAVAAPVAQVAAPVVAKVEVAAQMDEVISGVESSVTAVVSAPATVEATQEKKQRGRPKKESGSAPMHTTNSQENTAEEEASPFDAPVEEPKGEMFDKDSVPHKTKLVEIFSVILPNWQVDRNSAAFKSAVTLLNKLHDNIELNKLTVDTVRPMWQY